MIGIANQKLWNLGVGLLSKWNAFTFFLAKGFTIKYSMPGASYFCVLLPATFPQPDLG